MKKIVCFGEMLWDILPSGKMAGGAPMNVAIHLKYHGYSPTMISRVGSDDLGTGLLDFLKEKGISTDYVQVGQTHLTGVVKANVTDKNSVTYKIVFPVAYDYIQLSQEALEITKNSDVFIYGSLAARSEMSKDTLFHLLDHAKFKVFDVNLRPPHYTALAVLELIEKANVLKVNENELQEIRSWFGDGGDESENMLFLLQKFNLEMLILTRGDKGAAVLTQEAYYSHSGYEVTVEDTIGSGDAFLASFLASYLNSLSIDECLQKACKVGALVACYKGATPQYDVSNIELINV